MLECVYEIVRNGLEYQLNPLRQFNVNTLGQTTVSLAKFLIIYE